VESQQRRRPLPEMVIALQWVARPDGATRLRQVVDLLLRAGAAEPPQGPDVQANECGNEQATGG